MLTNMSDRQYSAVEWQSPSRALMLARSSLKDFRRWYWNTLMIELSFSCSSRLLKYEHSHLR